MTTLRALLLAGLLLPLAALAQGTAFTFQGRLHGTGAPASGPVLLRVTPWDNATGGIALAPPVEAGPLELVDGVFTTMLDFGPAVFLGTPVWLEIEVDTDGAGYVVLAPRQAVTPTPYALQAQTVAVDGIDAFALQDSAVERASIAAGAVGAAQIDAGEVQRRVSSPCVEGTVLQAISQTGSPTCVPVGGAWKLLPDGHQQSEVNVLIEPTDAGSQPALRVLSGNQWSPLVGSGDGDLHIGTGVMGLSVGVATNGGGAGAVRMWTNGGVVDQLLLGSIAHGTVLAISGDQVGIGNSLPAATLDVAGTTRIRSLADATAPYNRSVQVEPDGDLVASDVRWHAVPGSAFSPELSSQEVTRFFSSIRLPVASGSFLFAPLQLPHGTRVTTLRLLMVDNSASDFGAYIVRSPNDDDDVFGSLPVQTAGADPAIRAFDSSAPALVIDNETSSYVLWVYLEAGTWQGAASELRSIRLRIE